MSRVDERRSCAWCREPLGAGKRSDARTCSKRCRQALHRFKVGVAPAATTRAMRFGYADPPYPGLAWRYYRQPEVDHKRLVEQLVTEFPDGWALSTSAKALQYVLSLCPDGVRVCPWVNSPRGGVSYRPRSSWEPLIVSRGRARLIPVAEDLRDSLVWGGRQHSHPDALVGMKPAAFSGWMFAQLGAQQGDALVDLFPGSGAVTRAWEMYTSPGAGETDLSRKPRGDTSREYSETSRTPGDDAYPSRKHRGDASLGAGETRQVFGLEERQL